MNKTDELVKVLKRLNAGESVDDVKKDAQDLLNQIDPTELSIAEQQLIENGMAPEDLRGLCTIHMDMLKGELEKLKASVEPGHPLDTLVAEHEQILSFLQELDSLNAKIQVMESIEPEFDELKRLLKVAEGLVSAEKHHEREEDALFPAMEKLGISGPPTVMRLEHDDLRPRKKTLLELVSKAGELETTVFKAELDKLAKHIVFNLRDHIFKEDHILYPAALQNISQKAEWQSIKEKCDRIGYCSFTPNR